MRELLALVKAIMRRVQLDQKGENQTTKEILEFDNLMRDERKYEVYLHEKPLKLKPKEYDLLLYLCTNASEATCFYNNLQQTIRWTHPSNRFQDKTSLSALSSSGYWNS